LRGALSLALALSLPATFGDDRFLLRTMAFGVALFTLLIQATTMKPLIRKLKIITTSPVQVEYEQRHARLNALRSAEAHIERRYREGLISAPAWERIKPKLQTQTALLADSLRQLLRVEPKLESEELELARREILRAQRSAYLGMRGDGVISEEIFETLTSEIDAALENDDETFWYVPQESLPDRLNQGLSGSTTVNEVVVQSGAACDGQKVMDIHWPKHFVIASIKRGNQVIIPKGDTVILANDLLTMVGENASIEEARHFCE
jgi:NhaP-type Na+/H+ or K+/H+ antiporter